MRCFALFVIGVGLLLALPHLVTPTESGVPALLAATGHGEAATAGDQEGAERGGGDARRERPPIHGPVRDARILVFKSQRRLELFAGDRLLRSWPITLGPEPRGHKQVEGDGRTPEGEYYICVRNSNSRYHLSLGLSYPNIDDARRGLEQGLITEREAGRIIRANEQGRIPPWYTALGGEIFIRGPGREGELTRGSIALSRRDIEELFNAVGRGTPVVIHP